jgi:hypothetical protein
VFAYLGRVRPKLNCWPRFPARLAGNEDVLPGAGKLSTQGGHSKPPADTPVDEPQAARRSHAGHGVAAACIAAGELLRLADFVAYDATDYRSSRRSQKAATKNATRNAAYAGANCGVPVLRGHPAATAQADQHRCGNCTDYTFLHRFHWNSSTSNIG